MKKKLIAAAIATSFSMPTMADFLGLYAGLDYRSNETSLSGSSDEDSTSNVAGYVTFEHFIPLVPNVKLKYADLSFDDSDSIDSSSMNGILYYELFDNGLFEFDLGAAYSDIESDNDSANLAQLYAAGKVHIPGTGVHAFAEGIAGSFTDDDALDTEVGLAYTFSPIPLVLDMSLRAGYRLQELEFKGQPKQTTDGLFAGLEIHF